MLRFHRLTVFVNTDERHVDVEAREVEVVRIAAEERGLKLRHEHQTNVGVLLVTIKIVLSALVKRDDVGAQPGGFRRLRFDRGNLRASRRKSFGVSRTSLYRAGHA